MASYFFDSSGLVKRYVRERGTAHVFGLTDPAAGNSIHLARITAVEVIAAIARRERNGNLSAALATQLRADFRFDLDNQYRPVAITPSLLAEAMDLAESYALRGYDAVQLAAAVRVDRRPQRRGGRPLTLVSADLELNAAAIAEGLAVEDPNAHP